MIERLFSTIENMLHRAEDHIVEWRRQYQARNAEAEADRDKLWAEAKEREKLLAKTIGEEEARHASVGEGTEQPRFVFVVHSEEASEALVSLAGKRHCLVSVAPGGRSTGVGTKGSWLGFETPL